MENIAVPGLLNEVRRYGNFDVNGCLNCGSCVVTCNLSNHSISFPRRPIQYTLLGLKNTLLQATEPWLCYDCGDCSTTCPSQAEPRESMMTLRRYLIGQYDRTGLASRILTSNTWHLSSLSFVFLLILATILLYHLYYIGVPFSDLLSIPMGMEHMFDTIQYFTWFVYLFPLLFVGLNVLQMHRFVMDRTHISFHSYLLEAKTFLFHLFTAKNLKKCGSRRHQRRWLKHWFLIAAPTLMLLLTFFFLDWFQTDALYPFYHPQRWLGYLATAALVLVPADMLWERISKRGQIHEFSELSDYTLPILLLLVSATGIAVHWLRYMNFGLASLYLYAIHLAFTVSLLWIEIPFGKWSHMIYRPLALYFQAVRERGMQEVKAA